MQTLSDLSEDQTFFLAGHFKLLKYFYELATSHEDNAEAAIADLQQNAFPLATAALDDTPLKNYEAEFSPKKRYKLFCKECVATFGDPSLDLSQNEVLYLFPCTLYEIYLGKATDAELTLLKLIRRLKKRESKTQGEVGMNTLQNIQLQLLSEANTKLESEIADLKARCSSFESHKEQYEREKHQFESKIQRLNDELAALHRRQANQHATITNGLHTDVTMTTTEPKPALHSDVRRLSRSPAKRDNQHHLVRKPIDEDSEDDLLLVRHPKTNNNGSSSKVTEPESNKSKKKQCVKCGKGGHLYTCQRCKQRYHEACGGPYAKDDDDDEETTARIINNENEAVIQFLTEGAQYGATQFDTNQIDELRNRKLCQLYCRMCRREQGIISDGSTSSSSTGGGDDESNWSTDSSDIREREMREALDISRFPPTQKESSEDEIQSVSSTTSSQRQRLKQVKRDEKKKRKLQQKLLKKRNIDEGESDGSDEPRRGGRSRYILDEAGVAHSSDSDFDERNFLTEDGFEKHRKATANRMIKRNHKRRRKVAASSNQMESDAEDKNDAHENTRQPVLDEDDLNVLDVLGLEAPKGAKIKKSRKKSRNESTTANNDESPAGRTRDQAVEISQSQESMPSPQRNFPVTAARQQALLNTLRFVNPNALSLGGNRQLLQAGSSSSAGAPAMPGNSNRPVNRSFGIPAQQGNDDFWGASPPDNSRAPAAERDAEDRDEPNAARPDQRLLFSSSANTNTKNDTSSRKRGF